MDRKLLFQGISQLQKISLSVSLIAVIVFYFLIFFFSPSPAPELEELSIILSQSATKLQLQGRRLSSLANFIELFSSPTSDSRIPKSELDCTFSSVSPFSYNLYTLTCSVSGTLPLGDLYAEVLSHGGRSNRVKVANIVPAAEVQSRIDYKRAVNATQLTIIGNNFAVAPLEKSNVVTFLDNSATCEVSEETTATELVCNILGTLKEGVLYVRSHAFLATFFF